jgi:xanthine dehydrogenase accessory factor
MATSFYHALCQWFPLRHEHQWVLGAVVRTRGSVYRKSGALMLLSDAGHQLGLLSGGCLEGDLLLQARKVIALGKSRQVTYDANDEGSLAWRLGIGCGGAAEILLHPCHSENAYLALDQVFEQLRAQQACRYQLALERDTAVVTTCPKAFNQRQPGKIIRHNDDDYLLTLINPLPHLLILGSGVDMVPVCDLARAMGWRVTLADQRLSHQRRDSFPAGIELLQVGVTDLDTALLQQVDGVIVAHHNVALDAVALQGLRNSGASYIGLLGPAQRKREVLAAAGLSEHHLPVPVAGPMGLALGGDLPESIALSVLAECHAVIHGSTGAALSEAYAQEAAQDISGPRPNLGTFNAAG